MRGQIRCNTTWCQGVGSPQLQSELDLEQHQRGPVRRIAETVDPKQESSGAPLEANALHPKLQRPQAVQHG